MKYECGAAGMRDVGMMVTAGMSFGAGLRLGEEATCAEIQQLNVTLKLFLTGSPVAMIVQIRKPIVLVRDRVQGSRRVAQGNLESCIGSLAEINTADIVAAHMDTQKLAARGHIFL